MRVEQLEEEMGDSCNRFVVISDSWDRGWQTQQEGEELRKDLFPHEITRLSQVNCGDQFHLFINFELQ